MSLKRSCHEGVQRALSRHFMTSLKSLLFIQVNWGPLNSRSSKLQLFRKSLKWEMWLRLGKVETFFVASNIVEVTCNKPGQRKGGGKGGEVFPELQVST